MSAKKTVKKKVVAKKAAAKKKTPAKKKTAAKKRVNKVMGAEQRYQMIQDAAYYLAEKSGFSGNTVGHWFEAEQQIDAQLKKK